MIHDASCDRSHCHPAATNLSEPSGRRSALDHLLPAPQLVSPESQRGRALLTRPFTTLAGSVVLLGLADSIVGSYYVLFLNDHAHLSATQIGVLFSLPALGGIAFTLWSGRRFDRRPTRTWALLATASSAVGYALLTTTTSFAWLLLISMTLLALYQAIYPQLFSMAPTVLGAGALGQRAVPLLRSSWSLAWALGPLIAGLLLVPWIGFLGVLWVTVGLLILTLLTTAVVPSPGSAPGQTPAPDVAPGTTPTATATAQPRGVPHTGLVLLTVSVVLFFLAMFAGGLALPLYVTHGLGLPDAVVGTLFALCAVVEVLAALAVVALPPRLSQRGLLVGAMFALALHFALTAAADGVVLLLIAQVPRGVAITVLTTAGMRFFQEILAPATGFATTLFSASADAGFLLSGVVGGIAVDVLGYRPALIGCGVTAVLAGGVFLGSKVTAPQADAGL
ncbi:MFS transporter [Kineococcus sp. R86509]|uniref:MFS transporter n=1 Tax=Kineococcus sp. R86509 TaxID=3093851 RepID=UPI0036D2A3DA